MISLALELDGETRLMLPMVTGITLDLSSRLEGLVWMQWSLEKLGTGIDSLGEFVGPLRRNEFTLRVSVGFRVDLIECGS